MKLKSIFKRKKKAKEAEVKSDSTASMTPAQFQAWKLKRMKEGKMRTSPTKADSSKGGY